MEIAFFYLYFMAGFFGLACILEWIFNLFIW